MAMNARQGIPAQDMSTAKSIVFVAVSSCHFHMPVFRKPKLFIRDFLSA